MALAAARSRQPSGDQGPGRAQRRAAVFAVGNIGPGAEGGCPRATERATPTRRFVTPRPTPWALGEEAKPPPRARPCWRDPDPDVRQAAAFAGRRSAGPRPSVPGEGPGRPERGRASRLSSVMRWDPRRSRPSRHSPRPSQRSDFTLRSAVYALGEMGRGSGRRPAAGPGPEPGCRRAATRAFCPPSPDACRRAGSGRGVGRRRPSESAKKRLVLGMGLGQDAAPGAGQALADEDEDAQGRRLYALGVGPGPAPRSALARPWATTSTAFAWPPPRSGRDRPNAAGAVQAPRSPGDQDDEVRQEAAFALEIGGDAAPALPVCGRRSMTTARRRPGCHRGDQEVRPMMMTTTTVATRPWLTGCGSASSPRGRASCAGRHSCRRHEPDRR
jgi:hypothetical protein